MAPATYCRYVDDIFVDVRDTTQLENLIEAFEQNSVLHFTFEKSQHNILPFLDVTVEAKGDRFITDVYRKPSNTGVTMNGGSECPERYKKSVIRAFVRRAMRVCSSYELMHAEFGRIKQLLVNNGFTNTDVDKEISFLLDIHMTKKEKPVTQNTSHIYYRNYMNSQHKTDEKVLKNIVSKNVKATDSNVLKLHIYYQNMKTKNLVLKNNPVKKEKLKRTNVVYKFSCPNEDCRLRSVNYIGVTSTSLSRRLTMHLKEGAPKEHMEKEHKVKLSRIMMTENTDIIDSAHDIRKLHILEALHILEQKPLINKQINQNNILVLFNS